MIIKSVYHFLATVSRADCPHRESYEFQLLILLYAELLKFRILLTPWLVMFGFAYCRLTKKCTRI